MKLNHFKNERLDKASRYITILYQIIAGSSVAHVAIIQLSPLFFV